MLEHLRERATRSEGNRRIVRRALDRGRVVASEQHCRDVSTAEDARDTRKHVGFLGTRKEIRQICRQPEAREDDDRERRDEDCEKAKQFHETAAEFRWSTTSLGL